MKRKIQANQELVWKRRADEKTKGGFRDTGAFAGVKLETAANF